MAITQDASTPTVSTGTGTTTPLTSPSFSPPSGSLVLVLAGAGWSNTGTVGMTVTDSGSHTWTNPVTCIGHVSGNGGGVGIWYSYFASAPGSITVSVAYTGLVAGSGGRMLRVVVLDGAASSQAGAGTASNSYNATTGTVSVTTTTTGSLVWGVSDDTTSNHSWTPNAATTTDSTYNDSTDVVSLVSWKATSATGTPGATTLGGTWSGSGNTNQCAFEVLPASGGLTITGDTPSGLREGGPAGTLSFGITLTGDTASGARWGGPGGTVTASGAPVTVTGDTPAGIRAAGPAGTLIVGSSTITITGDTAAAARSGGPDGSVTAASPVVSPVYGPASLQVPTWSVWVADTRTGKLLWSVPASTFTWSSPLGSAGSIQATLIIESTYDALSDQDERDPRVLLRTVLTSPWRFSLVLRWGLSTVWAGPLITYSRQGATAVAIGGAEVAKLLEKRVMVQSGATSATDPTADLVCGPGTKQRVAYLLISAMLTGTGNDLPITVGDPGGFGIDQRTYFGYDLSTYAEKLTALSAELDGPEVRFDPQVTTGSDGYYLSWTVQIGGPHVGRNATTWEFDSSSVVMTEDMDASGMAMNTWVSGSGTDRDKLIANASNAYLGGLGWPMLEAVDTGHSSETLYPILATYATADLAAYGKPVTSWGVQVSAETDPMPGTYRTGEDVVIDVRNDPAIPDGLYTRRITSISGDQSHWVSLGTADPLPAGAT